MTEPDQLFQLGDSEDEPAFAKNARMLIYGYPGSGKTVFWGTGGAKVLILDSDGGTRSAQSSGSKASVLPMVDFDGLREAYDYLKHEALPAGKFDWVVWDSITLFQDRSLIDDITKVAAAANPRQDPDVPGMREYLISQNRIAEAIRLFSALPCHFGVSALVLPGEDPEGNIVYQPDIRGKGMTSKVSGYMNIVAYLASDGSGKRRLITGQKENYFGKDRYHKLLTNGKQFVDRPTLPKVEKLLFGAPKASATKGRTVRRKTTRKQG